MSFQLLLALAATLHAVQGIVFPQPKPTPQSDNLLGLLNGRSPKPTAGPQLGAISNHQLLARQDQNLNTCGWWNANAHSAVTCDAGSQCVFFTAFSPVNFGCCDAPGGSVDPGTCPYIEGCIDNGDSENGNVGGYNSMESSVLLCGTMSPSCFTELNIDNEGNTAYHFGCDSEAATYTMYAYTNHYSQSSSYVPASSSHPAVNIADLPSSTTSPTPKNNGPQTTPTSGGGSSGDSSNSSPSSKSKSSSNIGPIVGGIVGAVGGLALIGGLIGFLIWRKKKARVAPVPEVSQYTVYTKS